MSVSSPAHRQYLAVKDRFPDAIVLFRMGDFYEMFGDDAKVGSQTLGIHYTSREFGRGDRVPMCGFPHHAVQTHLKRFVEHGLKVAICEQLSEPGQGLVERDVVRVVTPGTLVEDALLDARQNNYLAAVAEAKDCWGLAYVDVTTGEFALTEFCGPDARLSIEADLLRLCPSETLVARPDVELAISGNVTVHDDYRFDTDIARDALHRHFKVRSLEGFGCQDMPAAIGAAGAIVSYVERANRALLPLLVGLRTYQVSNFMTLDRYTRRNLELIESARSGVAKGSLLWVIDRTQTAMGGRLLRRMLGQPLLDVEQLNLRLDVVAELFELPVLRTELRVALAAVGDLERLSGRLQANIAQARDLLILRDSLRALTPLSALLCDAQSLHLQELRDRVDPCDDVSQQIEQAVAENDPLRVIKPGYSDQLDAMVGGIRDAREWIAQLEGVERERTGIRSLKVGYNKVFGYYIEISHANAAAVPEGYMRKQTLVNAERFITPELKEYEARIVQAEDRIGALERELFSGLLERLRQEVPRLVATADALAHVDVYRSLADVAAQNGYVRPHLDTSDRLDIVAGRHPVVEASLEDSGFIPNDVCLDSGERQILLLTGPNMGGKSTFLRQVALIVLMAQMGSFVPAERAQIGLVDRIFSRVGAQDDIASGQSTFMVEMVETANILNHATARSLLVLDEVGRGTSTYDGLAIARAVVEYIHDTLGARTLFATHYHELIELADRMTRIHNANVAVAEDGSDVVFLHRVVAGGTDRSYGIHVARLAGLPQAVTHRADDVLRDLEERARTQTTGEPRARRQPQQVSLFGVPAESLASEVLDEILELDISELTPIQAITRLHELQQRGRGGV